MRDIILESLRVDFATASKLEGLSQPPSEYLVVIDRYGDYISSESKFPTISDDESHTFSVRLVKWLEQKSTSLIDSSISDAAASMKIDADSFLNEKNQGIYDFGRGCRLVLGSK